MNVRYCDFSNAKVGDKVFCLLNGEGIICDINTTYDYPIRVMFNNIKEDYNYLGFLYETHFIPALYHNKFDIQIPEEAYSQPLPDIAVDTPMLVWKSENSKRFKRYFKEFDKDGKVRCFSYGQTSFTSDNGLCNAWINYEIVKLSQ